MKYLNPANQAQLPYIERASRRLARKLFHTMGKYKEKLEYEQCILSNFVEIGVDLFAMAAVLAHAEAKLAQNPNDQSPQELADLCCKERRVRIERKFEDGGKNQNSTYDQGTEELMKGEFSWMYEEDVYLDVPPEFRTEAAAAPAQSETETTAEEPVPAK